MAEPVVVAKAVVVAGNLAIGAIRAAHSRRRAGRVRVRPGGARDRFALVMAVAGFIVPIVWATSSVLTFADHPALWPAIGSGAAIQLAALYLFHRAHADLGTNWSSKLQLFDAHELITTGVYSRIRHPMYLSLILFGAGQALVVPNWIAAPACLVGTIVLCALRVGPEEAMMRDRFAQEYETYMERTGRLWPRS
jgi:protein-S-isoprenylcysteine O-methyltransferase Ste14